MEILYFNDRYDNAVTLDLAVVRAQESIAEHGREFIDFDPVRPPTVDDVVDRAIEAMESGIVEADHMLCDDGGGPELDDVDSGTYERFRAALREFLVDRIDLSSAAWQPAEGYATLRVYADRHEFLSAPEQGEP